MFAVIDAGRRLPGGIGAGLYTTARYLGSILAEHENLFSVIKASTQFPGVNVAGQYMTARYLGSSLAEDGIQKSRKDFVATQLSCGQK